MKYDDFCIMILTHGRAGNVTTVKTLKRQGYTGPIVIVIDNEDDQADKYIAEFGDMVEIFDKAAIAEKFDEADNFNDRRAIFYARNACFEIAKKRGYTYFMELDDDYTSFSFCFDGEANFVRRTVKNMDNMLNSLLDYYVSTPRIDSLAIAQGGDMIGGIENSKVDAIRLTRKAMNSFICSTERPFSFMGRVNEDVNTYSYGGSTGKLFFTTFLYMLNQKQTQSNKGGMTDLYLDSGTYVKSFYTIIHQPSSAVIKEMGNKGNTRLHHHIDWNRTVPKILREEIKV